MEARCQCGLVHFTIPTQKPLALVVCHCNKCKLITGSVFNISAVFPYFEFPPSDLLANVGVYSHKSESGNIMDGYFCKGCGNRMAHTGKEDKGWVSVSAVRIVHFDWKLLEDKELTVHCWTASAVVPIPEGFRSFEGQPFR